MYAPGTAYAAVDAHLMDDFRPLIYQTDNFGKTWTQTTKGLPDHAYVHAVREDPKRKGLLFAGTEMGVFVSFNDGLNWQPLQSNLPIVPVHDLIVKNDDLVVATHGRAFWILDDISVLRQINEHITSEAAFLFTPQIAFRTRDAHEDSDGELTNRAGSNPPNGAVIEYFLKVAPTDKITLEILDSRGSTIRRLTSGRADPNADTKESLPNDTNLPASAGLNRFVWNLQLEQPTGIPGAIYMEGSKLRGTTVLPGAYTVKLTAMGKTLSAPLQMKIDPTITTSQGDLEKQFELAVKISDRISQAHEIVSHIRYVRAQLQSIQERLSGAAESEQIVSSAKALGEKISAVEDALFQVHKTAEKDSFNYGGRLNDMFIALHEYVEQADVAPTAATYQVFDYLDQQHQKQMALWRSVLDTDIPAFNSLVLAKGIPILGLPAAPSVLRTAATSH